jgi:hypothetical protein
MSTSSSCIEKASATINSTSSLSTPIKERIIRVNQINPSKQSSHSSTTGSIANTERKRLLERKRELEAKIDTIETRQRRQAMMATFQRQVHLYDK